MLCVVSLQAEESCIFDECVTDITTEESRLEVMLWEISGKIEDKRKSLYVHVFVKVMIGTVVLIEDTEKQVSGVNLILVKNPLQSMKEFNKKPSGGREENLGPRSSYHKSSARTTGPRGLHETII